MLLKVRGVLQIKAHSTITLLPALSESYFSVVFTWMNNTKAVYVNKYKKLNDSYEWFLFIL